MTALRSLIGVMTRPRPADRLPTVAAVCERLTAIATSMRARRQQLGSGKQQQKQQRVPFRPLDSNTSGTLQRGKCPAKRVAVSVGDENMAPAAAGSAVMAAPGVRQLVAL